MTPIVPPVMPPERVHTGLKEERVIYVGTSGWQYRDWRERFYPKGLPQRRWLEHYAARFPVVEVNNSFYQLPTEATFEKWRTSTPSSFVLAVKASRYITHIRRLRDCGQAVDLFWSRAQHLGEKLGPVLFQLPPTLRAEPALIDDFLRLLPRRLRPAFEFRHQSWWTDDVAQLLDGRKAAWVLADRPGARVPEIVTGGWSYVRFHQGRRTHPGYTRGKLARWADRLAGLPANVTYAFFNNDPGAAAPEDARRLMGLLEARGQGVARSEFGDARSDPA